jgi:hypothetical protein
VPQDAADFTRHSPPDSASWMLCGGVLDGAVALVTGDALDYSARQRAEADRYAADARAVGEGYATKLTADAEDYADRTLDEMAAVLHRSAATAEQGRAALRQRRAGAWTTDNPGDGEWSSISA